MINIDILFGIIPKFVFDQLHDTMIKFNISNELRLCHFLGQCDHESNFFMFITENLYYSAKNLLKIFPKYFNNENVNHYAGRPILIANKVYSGRMGNGSESSGDGWKYRGRGYIQLTGKNNYIKFNNCIEQFGDDCIKNPDIVASKYPLSSAAFFFDSNNIWNICDKIPNIDTIKLVTKAVNGGLNGLMDRVDRFNKYAKVYRLRVN